MFKEVYRISIHLGNGLAGHKLGSRGLSTRPIETLDEICVYLGGLFLFTLKSITVAYDIF